VTPSRPSERDLEALERTWTELGGDDPLWAILSDPAMVGGGWAEHLPEFFASGRREVEVRLERLRDLGLEPPSRAALDFGCGVGRLTRALAQHFEEAHGVDIAATMLAAARARGDRGCFYHHNPRPDLALFPPGRFSLVYSRLVLQHMAPPLMEGYLREFARVTEPGGVIVVQVPERRRGPARLLAPLASALRGRSGGASAKMRIEMHGLPRPRVEAVLAAAGARLVAVDPDRSAGSRWASWMYYAALPAAGAPSPRAARRPS
jgi:SAM-dependent methyltransferase